MIEFVLSVKAKGKLLPIAEQIMVVHKAIFMHKVVRTEGLESRPFVLIVALQVAAVNCPPYSANSVHPRATATFSRGTRESKQVTSNEEHESNKIRFKATTAANKKKVIMIEAKVNALKSLCVVDTGASVSLLGQSQWEPIKADSKVVCHPGYDVKLHPPINRRLNR